MLQFDWIFLDAFKIYQNSIVMMLNFFSTPRWSYKVGAVADSLIYLYQMPEYCGNLKYFVLKLLVLLVFKTLLQSSMTA